MKLALEDELTEGITGADSIESSYAYHLNLARDAAAQADALGDELVQQGLQMDMRAEDAREALEDLCGGVVNVGRLQEVACNSTTAKCDLGKLLTQADSTLPADIVTELEALTPTKESS